MLKKTKIGPGTDFSEHFPPASLEPEPLTTKYPIFTFPVPTQRIELFTVKLILKVFFYIPVLVNTACRLRESTELRPVLHSPAGPRGVPTIKSLFFFSVNGRFSTRGIFMIYQC